MSEIITLKHSKDMPACGDEMQHAAQLVQNVAYSLADKIGNNFLIELLMLSSTAENLSVKLKELELSDVTVL